MRDLLIRFCNCQDTFWFKDLASPWKLHLVHPWAKKVEVEDPVTHKITLADPYLPSEWRERVLNLCEYEFTHQNFGMGYKELMALDVATFEDIEDRVHAMAERRSQEMQKLSKAGSATPQGNDILKGFVNDKN